MGHWTSESIRGGRQRGHLELMLAIGCNPPIPTIVVLVRTLRRDDKWVSGSLCHRDFSFATRPATCPVVAASPAGIVVAAVFSLLIVDLPGLAQVLVGTFAFTGLLPAVVFLVASVFPAMGGLRFVVVATLTAASAILVAVDLWRWVVGFFAGATSAISMPNTSAKRASSSTLPTGAPLFVFGRPAPPRVTRSLPLTRRRVNRNTGCSSKRAPTP